MRGEPSQCHANTAKLWEINHEEFDVKIATGYGLSKDGKWRQHSWLVQYYEDNGRKCRRVIETTVKRVGYYGYELNDREARRFYDDNY